MVGFLVLLGEKLESNKILEGYWYPPPYIGKDIRDIILSMKQDVSVDNLG